MTKDYIVTRRSAPPERFEASGFYGEKSCIVFYEAITQSDGSKVFIKQKCFLKNDVVNIRCIFKGR